LEKFKTFTDKEAGDYVTCDKLRDVYDVQCIHRIFERGKNSKLR
jgi:hypothetical protein